MTRLQIILLRHSMKPTRDETEARQRHKPGITQAELASRLNVPVRTVEGWERKNKPRHPSGFAGKILENWIKQNK